MHRDHHIAVSIAKGLVLGVINASVIGAAAAVCFGEGVFGFLIITTVGIVPALAGGVLLGRVAATLDYSPRVRFVMLALIALVMVTSLGFVLQMPVLILPSYLPTLAAASILERWTRVTAAIPPVRSLGRRRYFRQRCC